MSLLKKIQPIVTIITWLKNGGEIVLYLAIHTYFITKQFFHLVATNGKMKNRITVYLYCEITFDFYPNCFVRHYRSVQKHFSSQYE